MEDQMSAIEMAVKACAKLGEVNPEHDLIKIMSEGSDEDFIKRFWDKEVEYNKFPGSMVAMRVETNYFLAVKKELKEKHNIEI